MYKPNVDFVCGFMKRVDQSLTFFSRSNIRTEKTVLNANQTVIYMDILKYALDNLCSNTSSFFECVPLMQGHSKFRSCAVFVVDKSKQPGF